MPTEAADKVMSGWLQRRFEAMEDARTLAGLMLTGANAFDILRAQQHWASGMFLRLVDDTSAVQTLTERVLELPWGNGQPSIASRTACGDAGGWQAAA